MTITGILFPLESYDNCIDSVETPKTVALQIEINKSLGGNIMNSMYAFNGWVVYTNI